MGIIIGFICLVLVLSISFRALNIKSEDDFIKGFTAGALAFLIISFLCAIS